LPVATIGIDPPCGLGAHQSDHNFRQKLPPSASKVCNIPISGRRQVWLWSNLPAEVGMFGPLSLTQVYPTAQPEHPIELRRCCTTLNVCCRPICCPQSKATFIHFCQNMKGT
jgi:hypothetical protein